MHSASAKIDGEPYALRGARTVRGEALGNLFSNAEQGALRLLHRRKEPQIQACPGGSPAREGPERITEDMSKVRPGRCGGTVPKGKKGPHPEMISGVEKRAYLQDREELRRIRKS